MARIFNLSNVVDDYCSKMTQGGRSVSLSDVVDHVAALSGRLEENIRKSVIPLMMERYLRVGEETFVSNKTLCFNVSKIDALIAKKLDKREYMAIQAFEPFCDFPSCSNNWSWNLFVFESYCLKYSKRFKILSLIFNKQCSGVVISKRDDRTFFDVAVDFIAQSPLKKLTIEDIVNYLKKNGFIGKAKYYKCQELIEQVTQLRQMTSISDEVSETSSKQARGVVSSSNDAMKSSNVCAAKKRPKTTDVDVSKKETTDKKGKKTSSKSKKSVKIVVKKTTKIVTDDVPTKVAKVAVSNKKKVGVNVNKSRNGRTGSSDAKRVKTKNNLKSK